MTLGDYLREEGEKSRILFDLWICPRPYTRHWGSGQVFRKKADSLKNYGLEEAPA